MHLFRVRLTTEEAVDCAHILPAALRALRIRLASQPPSPLFGPHADWTATALCLRKSEQEADLDRVLARLPPLRQ